ncbi:hypothetical protein HYU14_04180 [Candidatus Woesearchaeota archaeon]|nr:hypothetical protein [Candidatus Woesearchaeota archaeon]
MFEIEELSGIEPLSLSHDYEQLMLLNQHVCHSLRKKGVKLREFKWHEVQAS